MLFSTYTVHHTVVQQRMPVIFVISGVVQRALLGPRHVVVPKLNIIKTVRKKSLAKHFFGGVMVSINKSYLKVTGM